MTKNDNIGDNIFTQICQVNDLDPDKIREVAQQQKKSKTESDNPEYLISTAFNYRARQLVKGLELGSTINHENIQQGNEYTINPDPAAPSFTINEDYIHQKYSEAEAKALIDALGKVMLPIRA